MIILASMKPVDFPSDMNSFRISRAKVDDDFSLMILSSEYAGDILYDEYGIPLYYDPFERNPDFMMRYYVRSPSEIDAVIKDVLLINTDDWPVLEFATLRNKYRRFR